MLAIGTSATFRDVRHALEMRRVADTDNSQEDIPDGNILAFTLEHDALRLTGLVIVIASEAKQSRTKKLACFVASLLAMTDLIPL